MAYIPMENISITMKYHEIYIAMIVFIHTLLSLDAH